MVPWRGYQSRSEETWLLTPPLSVTSGQLLISICLLIFVSPSMSAISTISLTGVTLANYSALGLSFPVVKGGWICSLKAFAVPKVHVSASEGHFSASENRGALASDDLGEESREEGD